MRRAENVVTVDEEGESHMPEETYGIFLDEEDDNYVWINEGDLDEIFHEPRWEPQKTEERP